MEKNLHQLVDTIYVVISIEFEFIIKLWAYKACNKQNLFIYLIFILSSDYDIQYWEAN